MTKILFSCCIFCMLIAAVSCYERHGNIKHRIAEQDGMEEAMRQQVRMTRDPQLGYVPTERLIAAKLYMEELTRTGRGNGIAALSWQERGPNNIGGRTRTIVVDKRDATGNTVLAASVSGGIFKSVNFTSGIPTWTPVNDFLPNLAVTVMIQDQLHPDTLFAGTGEGWFNIDAVRGGGIFKSTDGGNSWSLIPSTSGFEYVQDLLIDNNGNLYAALRNLTSSNRGVMRSIDRGASWTQVLGVPLPGFNTGRAADLELAANGDIYASLGIFSRSQVLKSTFSIHGANTGAAGTWVDITPLTPTVTQRTEIVLAPSDAQRVYLMMQDSATDQVLNMYRSTNGGGSWSPVSVPSAALNGSSPQTWYNLIGAVDPANANTLVVGGLHLAKSVDAGDNWTNITTSSSVHVDHHALVYDGSNKLLDGNDGGIYYTTNATSSAPSFLNKDNSYNVTQFYACDHHPTNTNYFLAGAQDNNTQKFTSPGINSTVAVSGGDGGFPHIDQTDGQLQITANVYNNFYRSTNGGNSFSLLSSINNDRGQFINPSDFSDAQKIIYSGDDAGKYFVVNNLGSTPTSVQVSVPAMGTQELTAVKVDQAATSTIWIGASFGSPSAAPLVLKLTNANTASATVVVNTTLGAPAGSAISSIDIDPANSNHILVTLSSYGVPSVFESTNGGANFTSIEGNLPDMPVHWGMFAPATAQLNGSGGGNGGIILATELGVWTTSAISGSSTSWIPNNGGLANVRTDMLKYRSSDNLLSAASHGRGLFTTNIPNVVTGINDPGNTKDFIKYISSDRKDLLIVTGTLNSRGMTIQIINSGGQVVYERSVNYQDQRINLSRFASGVYTLRVNGKNNERYTRSFIK